MLVLFECGCKGCKFADVEFDVVRVGEDEFVSNRIKTCQHPSNENEYWIPYLHDCPLKEVE